MQTALFRTLAILGLTLALGSTSASDASWIDAFGVHLKLLTSSAETKGLNATLRVEVPPGVGPPAHIHTKEDETYVITRGHFRFWHGTQTIDATPGDVVFLPRNEPHQWLNVGTTTAEHVLIISPAGFERFFATIAKERLAMPKDSVEVLRLSAAYGIRYVPSLAPESQKH